MQRHHHEIRNLQPSAFMLKQAKLLLILLSLLFSSAVFALRCGNSLVDIGDYKNDVYTKCGAPESIDTRTKIIGNTFRFPFRTLDIQQYEEVQVETWIYNFGPVRFKHYMRFENGVLMEIKTLGRGH